MIPPIDAKRIYVVYRLTNKISLPKSFLFLLVFPWLDRPANDLPVEATGEKVWSLTAFICPGCAADHPARFETNVNND